MFTRNKKNKLTTLKIKLIKSNNIISIDEAHFETDMIPRKSWQSSKNFLANASELCSRERSSQFY